MKTQAALLFLALVCIAPHAQAAEGEMSTPAQTMEKSPIAQAAEDFTKDFDEDSARHFTIIYSNYNMLKVVETVQDDVEMATKKCIEVNPEMDGELKARHTAWYESIKPVLAAAEQNVNTMVLSQEYAKPKEIEAFFKKIDKERKKQAGEVKKMPVTSKEACEHLLKTMDSTQEQLIELLEATLVSTPQAVQRALDEREAAEKAEAAKREAEKDNSESAPVEAQSEAEPKLKEEAQEPKAADEKSKPPVSE